jgi:lysophospholipase L1-like esterase
MSARSLIALALILGCSDSEDPTPDAAGISSAGGSSPDTSGGAAQGGMVTGVGGQQSGPAGALSSSGVCGFDTPVTYGAPAADGMVDVPPDDPNIFYMGRVDCDPTGPSFAFPAVSVRLRFTGSALDLRFYDSGTGTAQSTNYYDVSIDGGGPTRLEMTAGDQVYSLARDLGDGEHTAEIVKRVESNGNSGKGQVLGFRVSEGAMLLPVAQKPLRVEFVGDSITCGYGDEISTTMPDMFHYTTLNSNANAAYGALVARELDAEYVAVAISGRGVYRNYSDGAGELAPVFYNDTLPDDAAAPAWDFTRYVPDAVVVNLGTNDFSPPGPDHAAYNAAYSAFLKQIRGHYPDALLLAVVGTMLSDGFPTGVMAWTTNQSDVSGVVSELAAQGDTNVHYLALTPQSAPFGEDYHPTLATHQQMAQAVATELERLLQGPQ